ncbi:hypothetical protein BMF35_a2116 [Aurantiacibacter gangjinensis]|nr:hypothetical protein BMF35_a2116 [Aurantiacibacter gangjinensis]
MKREACDDYRETPPGLVARTATSRWPGVSIARYVDVAVRNVNAG